MDSSDVVRTEGTNQDKRDNQLVYRHNVSARIWHWVNAVTVMLMLMSGLMILNAHPRLYWGEFGANFDPAWLELPHFPGWATIPSFYDLAGARRWHLAFAWLLVGSYLVYLLIILMNGHFWRDLAPSRDELRSSHLAEDLREHLRMRFPTGTAALHYNTLQKLSYLVVIALLLPLLILSGLAMSPALDAAWPWLLDIFGGRQSARSVHFLCAAAMTLFVLVHIAMVLLVGPINEIRSMITGRFQITTEPGK